MAAIEVDATPTTRGILARAMFDMILRAMRDFLTMHSYSSVTVHAAYVLWVCVYRLSDRHLFPFPLVLAGDQVFATVLAAQH